MQQVQLSDLRIIPDTLSIRNMQMSDDEYFSEKYKHFVSNSRLKWIDPTAGGSPKAFKSNPKVKTSSLLIGSAIHELLLQPDEFELAPKIGKPTAKLGEVMDLINRNVSELGLDEAIRKACIEADYFANLIDQKMDAIKATWEVYNKSLSELQEIPTDKTRIVLSDKDWDVVNACVTSCKENREIYNKLHPVDPFDDPVESHFEDAFFMNYIVTYKGKQCAIIPFKMKADNWTIDFDSKTVTLNDLKSTSHSVQSFMKEHGSWYNFSYARQMYVYSFILWFHCIYKYGISKYNGWRLNANMLVVETIPNYWSQSYYVTDAQLREGKKMFDDLLKRVGYYEIFGYDEEVEFV